MAITPLPAAPEPTDSTAEFNSKAFAWVAALDTFTTQANATAVQADASKDAAAASATNSANSATASAASATASASSASAALTHASAAAANTNAPLWVSGTTYAAGALVYSALDGRTYRRKTAGAGTTNPVSDSTNWTPLLLEVATLRPTIRPSLLLDFANSKRLDSRITYTRASTATYYGTRTAKAEQNLFTYSQEFDNATWAKIGLTATANTDVAPDGTTTAETITASGGASGARSIFQGVPSQSASPSSPVIFSVFAKKGTNNFIQLLTSQASNGFVNFDLDAGTATATTAIGAITSVGNGWYRCVMTITESAAFTTAYVNIVTGTGAVRYESNTLSTTALIWGAQLEQRSTVTAYQVTTTQPITNYIPVLETAASGVARFDHNPLTFESLGLLIEEQRTNLFTYSEQFDNAAWTKSNATVTANTIVSPDGTLDADKLVEGTTTARKYALQTGAASGRTFSVYAKAGGRNFISIGSTNGVGLWGVSQFNLSTGVFVNAVSVGGEAAPTSPTITSVGNGWYRVSVVIAGSSTSAVIMVTNGGDPVFEGYTGNGFDGIYIWGAQLEAGAFSTSYVQTVASQVTRAADSASMTGANFSSWFNAAQGTIYSESLYYYTGDAGESESSGFGSPVAFGDGVTNQFEPLAVNNATTRVRRSSSYYRTSAQALQLFESTDNTYLGNTQMKSAVAMAINDYASSVNGATVRTSAVPYGVVGTRLVIGGNYAQTNFSGTIKKIAYYPLRLSNTNLQALTG